MWVRFLETWGRVWILNGKTLPDIEKKGKVQKFPNNGSQYGHSTVQAM